MADKKLYCDDCARKEQQNRGGVVVPQGTWSVRCCRCGGRTFQAYEVVKP